MNNIDKSNARYTNFKRILLIRKIFFRNFSGQFYRRAKKITFNSEKSNSIHSIIGETENIELLLCRSEESSQKYNC